MPTDSTSLYQPVLTAAEGPPTAASPAIAIAVRNVSKMYPLYADPRDRLRQSLWYALPQFLRGQPRQFYREFWALREVSFEVKKGETVGIIGRNGSGKSTLLQIIAGTLAPTHGEVQVNGRVAALLELGSGFNPEFTGRENVYLNGTILGFSREEMETRFDQIAAFADIGQFMDQPVKLYSSGMVVRLAFSVIAHVDADVLIIDEALAVGDVFFVQKCMRFLRQFCERGTLLFVTHDTTSVMSLCQRAIWLHEGSMQRLGDPKDVTDEYLQTLFEAKRENNSVAVSHQKSDATTLKIDVQPKVNRPAITFSREDKSVEIEVDQRLQFLNFTQYRNDLKIGRFEPDAKSFADNRAKIVEVTLRDMEEHPLIWVVGGEMVTLRVIAIAHREFNDPIIGFFLRDRLGQTLFGDNTYLTTYPQNIRVVRQNTICAKFTFKMPVLPAGDYSITVAIASGTQLENEMLHWIYDAMVIKSTTITHGVMGLVGIPMSQITLTISETPS
jgi:lipopolysaccharide transport system ATP-binding protein